MNDLPRVFDAHADTLLRIRDASEFLGGSDRTHLDGPRLRGSPVDHQVLAICADGHSRPQEVWERGTGLWGELSGFDGCSLLLGVEGCSRMAASGRIPAGLAVAGLTWNGSTDMGGGIGTDEGLTTLGRNLARELAGRGVVLDVSHLCDRSRADLLGMGLPGTSATHCNCRRIHDHPRNLPDDDIREIARLGGVVGITFVPDFLGGEGAGLDEVEAHLEHAAGIAGVDHVGFGSDFDGVDSLPAGIIGCSSWGAVLGRLSGAGWSAGDVEKIAGVNWRRVFGV